MMHRKAAWDALSLHTATVTSILLELFAVKYSAIIIIADARYLLGVS